MALTKNQKIGGGIAALLLLIGGGILIYRKRSSKTVNLAAAPKTETQSSTSQDTQTATPVVTKTTAYGADGNMVGTSNKDIANEMYKSIVGHAAYLVTSKDSASNKIRGKVLEIKSQNPNMKDDEATLAYLVRVNKGKAGLKGALKMIDGKLSGHVNHYIATNKFKSV